MVTEQNYQDILEHFKVEELKERLEFDMAAEGGWNKKAKAKGKGEGGSTGKVNVKKAEAGLGPATTWSW